ncbi:MAG: ABC transporter ATP-binding protein [Deltaproteobacteria bacterium]|jgi:iron complex transport system ATP-binding protein|nr:ABC transporter ATP-binding protein [Deltaproteobacteria bacterium]
MTGGNGLLAGKGQPGDGQAILEASRFSFWIDKANILRDISFAVRRGEFLSIVGPNGAGKSTLLKCLLRLHQGGRSEGTITVAGRDLGSYGQRQLAKAISYVPQPGGWIPPFTVREFAKLSRFPHASTVAGLSPSDELAVDQALESVGMTGMANRNLKTMSGGERQKAYLAAALAQGAGIMLLDEPAASLDPRHASELAALLEKLNRGQGLTVVMVTHDLNHPLRAGGLALVLAEGERRYFGPASGLLENGVLEKAFRHGFLYLDHPDGRGRLVVAR